MSLECALMKAGQVGEILILCWWRVGGRVGAGGDKQMSALFAPLALPREADVLGQQVGTPRECGGAPCLGLW